MNAYYLEMVLIWIFYITCEISIRKKNSIMGIYDVFFFFLMDVYSYICQTTYLSFVKSPKNSTYIREYMVYKLLFTFNYNIKAYLKKFYPFGFQSNRWHWAITQCSRWNWNCRSCCTAGHVNRWVMICDHIWNWSLNSFC